MRVFILTLALLVCAATPAAAYGPSGKLTYNKFEVQLSTMTAGCRAHLDFRRTLNCLDFVDKVRKTTPLERLSPSFQDFISVTRILLGL